MDFLVVAVNVACWGAVVVVWVVAAIRDAGARPAGRTRARPEAGVALLVTAAVAVIVLVGPPVFRSFTVDAAWVRVIGAVLLVASTLFAIWARLALGRSWSIGPQASTERGVRTDGPYAITRHPIYTGLLGMMLGTALLGGLGQWITLVAAGLVAFGSKIRSEERLLLATFPVDYAAYRQRVPRLVPGWRWPLTRRGESH